MEPVNLSTSVRAIDCRRTKIQYISRARERDVRRLDILPSDIGAIGVHFTWLW
jgi:hypothetical protein